jgi:hypothetical protein
MTFRRRHQAPSSTSLFALLISAPGMLVFTGCAVLPTFGTARKQGDLAAFEKTVPAKWSVPVVATPGAATGWLDDFSSARLKSLVQTAIASNPDLRAAAARVEQARAQIRVAGAEALPQLGAGFDGSRSQRASGQRFVGIGTRSNRFNLQAERPPPMPRPRRQTSMQRACRSQRTPPRPPFPSRNPGSSSPSPRTTSKPGARTSISSSGSSTAASMPRKSPSM